MPRLSREALLEVIGQGEFAAQFGQIPVGVCAFAPLSDKLIPCRAQSRLPQNAQSVIVFLFPYKTGSAGNLSRYAIVPDYHGVVTPALEQLAEELRKSFPSYQFQAFCDNSPVPEVRAAAMSHLGVMGDNGLLIHPEYGSWVFIGEIVTDAEMEPTGTECEECLHCGRCSRICPGGVLGSTDFDRSLCLSHITQKKGELSPYEMDLIRKGGLVWGCDSCQEACPMNRAVHETGIARFLTGSRQIVEKGDALLLTDRAYLWRGPKVIERNLDLLSKETESTK